MYVTLHFGDRKIATIRSERLTKFIKQASTTAQRWWWKIRFWVICQVVRILEMFQVEEGDENVRT